MAYSGGVLETSSNIFVNSTSRDFVFRTESLSDKIVLGNTACNFTSAAVYVYRNAVGIGKSPGTNAILDVPGLLVDTSCNVTIANNLTVSTLSLSGNVIPSTDATYSIGSSNARFRDIYFAGAARFGAAAMTADSNTGVVTFLDPTTSNLRNVVCGQVSVGGVALSATADGALQYTSATSNPNTVSLGILSNVGYDPVNNFWGLGNNAPQNTLHIDNSNNATQMRIMLTDKTTNTTTSNTRGYQFWKDSTGQGYITNYYSGASINIQTTGTQNIGAPNINIGSSSSTGQVVVASLADALVTMRTATTQSNAGVVLDAASAGYNSAYPGARKFYIRSTGNAATSNATGDRAGLLEIGDMGGNSGDGDASGRSNLVVLDKFSRLWVGRNIVPGTMGAGVVGAGGGTDAQPALIIAGHSNSSGLKTPMLHLGRNATNSDLSGFGIQLGDNAGTSTLTIGRSDARSNSGNPAVIGDIAIDNVGNVALGLSGRIGTMSNKFTVVDTTVSSSNHSIVAVNNGSYVGIQPLAQAGSFNSLVGSNDARIAFSFSNTSNAGALCIVPLASSRCGIRVSATGSHEIAGGAFVSGGKFGVGNSNPTYDLDVTGQFRVTSNAYMSSVSTSNVVVASSGSLSVANISANGGILNVGPDSSTGTINIACGSNSQVVNIGTVGVSNTVINLGGPGDTINILGILNNVTMCNTTSCNKTIDLNYNGATGTGGSVGINIDEGGSITGYIRTSADRNSWLFKAPNAPETKIDCTGGGITIGGLTMNTSSNVGIGTNAPQYKLDVYGTLNATSYCNIQWSFISGIPSLSGFSNDLSNFTCPTTFTSNVVGNGFAVSNITVASAVAASSVTATTLTASNAALSNLTVSCGVSTPAISAPSFGTAMTIGCDCNTARLDIGTGATTLLNIGNNNDGTVINIGGIGDTVNIPGTLIATLAEVQPQSDGFYTYIDYGLGVQTPDFQNTTTQLVAPSLSVGAGLSPLGPTSIVSETFRIGLFTDPNKVFTLNKDNLANSGSNCGINIEENGVINGWLETTSDRSGWCMKGPGANQVFVISMGGNYVSFNSNSFIMVGDSNGTIGMGTNNPNTAYKLHVAGPLYANTYVNLPVGDAFGTVGTVSLCNAINSSSQTVAATAQAVQTAYNAAISACNVATGRWIATNASGVVPGIVTLCDATNSNTLTASTSSVAASPASVASTYAFAATKWASNVANSSTLGIAYLTDSTACNLSGDIVPIAASAKAVFLANQNANTKWTASFASNTVPGYAYISDATNCNRTWNTVDSLYLGPIAASVKAVYDTMQVASAASNRAFSNIPATGSNAGYVSLSDSPTSVALSNTSGFAATPYAVSQAYALASNANALAGTKWSNASASAVQQGTVYLMDAVGSNTLTSTFPTPYAATPYAVSQVNAVATAASNRAYAAWLSNNASSSVPGIVYITDSTSCNASSTNAVPVVPSASALSNVFGLATVGSNQAFTHPTTVANASNLGHVVLSDSYTDTTDDVTKGMAATPKAVGGLYNYLTTTTLTNVATATGTTTKGAVYLTDSTSCNVSQTSQPLAASAMAVYNAYQMAVAASNWASQRPASLGSASLTSQGAVQLSDDTTSTSTSLAATIASVTRTWNYAYNALQKAGGTLTGDLFGSNFKATGTVTAAYNGNFLQLATVGSANAGALIGNNTQDMRFGFASDINGTNWTEQMRLTAGGCLGIGTSNPVGPVQVSVGTYNNVDPTLSGIYVNNYVINNNMAHATMVLQTSGASGGNPYFAYDVSGVTGWSTGVDNSDGQKFKISNAYNSLTSATKLTVTTAGNVGINTTSPAYTLDVNGDGTVRGLLYVSSSNANVGNCYISGGPGDGATSNLYNLRVASWQGIGFYNTYAQVTSHYFNTRTGDGTFLGTVSANLLNTSGGLTTSGWVTSTGNVGWCNQTYGGGWYMTDSNWVRSYNDKGIYTGGYICSGRVGIGSTNPIYPLDVAGNSRLNIAMVGDCGYGSTYAAFGHQTPFGKAGYALLSDSNGVTYMNCAPGQSLRFRTSNADWGCWTSNGLGVGTSSPVYTLDVNGQVNCTSGYRISGMTGYMLDNYFGSNDRYGIYKGGGVTRIYTSGAYAPSGISLCQATGNNTFADQLFINHSGLVGIGTTSPQYQLDVVGDVRSSGTLRSDGWASPTYGGGWSMTDATWMRTMSNAGVWTGNGNVCGNGSFGVGTSNPGYKLDVQGGDINTSGSVRTGGTVRIDGSGNLSNIGNCSIGGNLNVGSGGLVVTSLYGNMNLLRAATESNANAIFTMGHNSNATYQTSLASLFNVGTPASTESRISVPSAGMFRVWAGSSPVLTANGGGLQINGALSKTSGTFDIPHPDPVKKQAKKRLRHSFVESPTAGDNIYRFKVTTTDNAATIKLPDYFAHLNENPQVWITAEDVLGYGCGKVDDASEQVDIKVSQDGTYNVLVIGTRKDDDAVEHWSRLGLEYTRAE